MSRTVVDSKVVEMRFDNAQFEKGTKETIGTLDKLREALKLPEAAKSLEDVSKAAKNISVDHLSNAVELLSKRFSTMGIVGMRVIENLTDAMMNKLSRAVSFVTDSIVSGGIKRAMNIENAHFQLQALLKDETKVQAVMADAMEAVDGTAYAYDEAAKAASQFSASGIQSGEEMLGALKGITGVAAMTNSSFEDISRVFTTVAGNGRLMGDQLLQLSSRGLNAASTLADYYKEVRKQSGMTETKVREMVSKGKISFKDFSDAMTWAFGDSAKRANETFTGALSNMKSAFARIGAGFISPLVEQNGELVKLFNALRVQVNNAKSAIVFDEQKSAISGLADASGMTSKKLEKMFAVIKKNGSVSTKELDKLGKKGVHATKALQKYINGVSNGSIRASYSTTSALEKLTKGSEISVKKLKKYVKSGKIDLATFQSAMETYYGNQKSISKQFTDFFLDSAKSLTNFIESTDLTDFFTGVNYTFESVVNVFKALGSVIKPVNSAFSETFTIFNGKGILKFTKNLEKLTSKMKLSEKGSKNLHDAAKGIFDVVKLLLGGVLSLGGAFKKSEKPVGSITELFLEAVGALGRLLSRFSEFTSESIVYQKIIDILATAIGWLFDSISYLGDKTGEFIEFLENSKAVQKFIEVVTKYYGKLSDKAAPYVDILLERLIKLRDYLGDMIPEFTQESIDNLINSLKRMKKGVSSMSFETFVDGVKGFTNSIKNLVSENKALSTFISNMNDFFKRLKKGFTIESLLNNVDTVREKIDLLISWFKDVVSPIFDEFSFGGFTAAAGGLGMLYTMFKGVKSFESIANSLKSVPKLLNNISGSLKMYQTDLKAGIILKIAGSIALLAAAITLLSFADMENAWQATIMLGLVGIGLVTAIGYLKNAMNRGRKIESYLTVLSRELGTAANNLAKAVKYRAIGKAFKDFGTSILMIAGSIIALGIFYRKDKEALEAGTKLVGVIAISLVGIIGLMSFIEAILPGSSFSDVAKSFLGVSLSLAIIVGTLKKLFKMELPDDADKKLQILIELIAILAGISIVLGISSRIAGKNGLKATTFIGLAALLVATVSSLKKLFEMNLPDDYKKRFGILKDIFVAIGALLLVIGVASKLAGGSLKAAGTILSISLFLVVVIGALAFLAIFPGDKLKKGAEALGKVLIALGVALYGAGKIGSKDAYKSILSMTASLLAITVALGILSLIPVEKLKKSVLALDAVLIALAYTFSQIGKIKNANVYKTVIAMIIATAAIATELAILAHQPWDGLLAAAGAMSITLLAFAKAFQMILKKDWSKNTPNKLKMFGVLIALTVPVAGELAILANQPWTGLLAAAGAMSTTLMMFALAYEQILNKKWSKDTPNKLKMFGIFVALTIPVAVELGVLANQPWQGLLAAAGVLSATMLAFVGAFSLIGKAKLPDTSVMAAFGIMVLATIPIAIELGILANQPWEGLLAAAGGLSLVLISMTACLGILSKVNANVGTAINAALALSSFIAVLGVVMVAIGALFSEVSGLEDYLDKGIEILIKIGGGLGEFVGAFVKGVIEEISNSLPTIGKNLSLFWMNSSPFFLGMSSLPKSTFKNIGLLAVALIGLTAAELINGVASFLGCDMGSMGTQLTRFWTNATPFFLGLSMIDPKTVKAGKSLASMILALTITELIQGISRILGLSGGTLADFGTQLEAFGPSIKNFAETVKDVNPKAVEGAAAAAQIMAEVANKLPAQEGLMQKIFGKKSLRDFAVQLLAFGPAIVKFSDIVKDVDPKSVKGAAAAAETMSEVANGLPSSGGLIDSLMGSNDIDKFGERLVSFGKSIKKFTNKVAGIDSSSVEGTAAVTEIMSKLSDELPNSGGAISWFTGNNDIDDFGEKLASFGKSFKKFYNKVEDIDSSQILAALDAFNGLVEMAKNVESIDIDKTEDFAEGLGSLAGDGIDDFCKAFANATEDVKNAVNGMLTSAVTVLSSKDSRFIEKATNSINLWIGMFKNNYITALAVGQSLAIYALDGAKAIIPKFKTAGEDAAKGFINGIKDKEKDAKDAGTDLGNAVYDSSRKALDERSPSKKMGEVGKYAGEGFLINLLGYVSKVSNAGTAIGDAVVNNLRDAVGIITEIVNSNIESEPVITPVVDLNGVRSSASDISSMFNRAIDIQIRNASGIDASTEMVKQSKSLSSEFKKLRNDIRDLNGDTYNVNGITYEESSDVSEAIQTLIRATKVKRRV